MDVLTQHAPLCQAAGDLRSEEGQRMVDTYHRKYVDALKALYDAHKEKYAPARRRSLDIVE